ncbi:WD40 repeat domain-containing protein [Zavarzinella formosa]|uniref:WD40 repeat domain-containing protein n=1 Tax=Zavarzinella formosa TaxID=360055 RepID=UPI000303A404|nr:WD40 repeat domain-containing protein [Zavarzinella formosa]
MNRCFQTALLALGLLGLLSTSPVLADPKPSGKNTVSSFDKLDREQMTPIDKAQLPDITVGVVTVDSGVVLSCALSVDGKLATGTDLGVVILWDMTGAAPKELAKLQPAKTKGRVENLVFSNDGKRLAVSLAGTLHVWDITEKGGKLFDSKLVGRIGGLVFSPDGKWIVCGSDNQGQLFAVEEKEITPAPGHFLGAHASFMFSADGGLFASVFFTPLRNGKLYGSEVKFWKMVKKKPLEYSMVQLDSGIKSIALSPDSKMMATGSLDNVVRIWDMTGENPEVKAKMNSPRPIRSLSFTPDGASLVAFSSGADILLYDVAKGEKQMAWQFMPRPNTEFATGAMYMLFSACATAPDGRHVAFANNTAKTVVMRLPIKPGAPRPVSKPEVEEKPRPSSPVSGADMKEKFRFDGHTSSVYGAAFLPDGKTALSWSFDQTVRRWDLTTGKETAKYPIRLVNDLAIFPDGKKAIFAQGQTVGTQRVTIWDFENGEEIAAWKGHEMSISHVRLLPDGKGAVTASPDGTAILWDIESGKKVWEFAVLRKDESDGLPMGVRRQTGVAISVSPDGKFLATGSSRSRKVVIWNLQTGKEVQTWASGHGEVSCVEYSPDGKYLLTTTGDHRDAGAQLWEAATGKLVREWLVGSLSSATFSPDGKRFLTTETKPEVRLWDVNKLIALGRFGGHDKRVTRAAFSPDGKTAISTGYDDTVRVWKLPD